MKGTETEFEKFVIDRTITPQRKLNAEDVEKSGEDIGSSEWRKRLECTLLGSVSTPVTVKKENNIRKKISCFNCDGEHNLRDCTQRKDFRRISRKKRESGDGRQRVFYNDVGISKQRERHFKPGVISDRLRAALGLRGNDIPEHIYRMRRLGLIDGYPPGWLRKSIKSTDQLKFFDSTSKEDDEMSVKPPELDTSKIVWYPGFNGEQSSLNDREDFKIPPRDVFCSVYQDELLKIFKKSEKAEKRRAKSTPKHKKFANEDDDDVIVITSDEIKIDKFNTPGEEDSIIILDGSASTEEKHLLTPIRKDVKLGESMFELIGTPVFGSSLLTPVAPLEAFAVGIQPFEAREELTGCKGNFRNLMDKLKEIRENNFVPEPEEEVILVSTNEISSSNNSGTAKNKNNQNRKRNRRHAK